MVRKMLVLCLILIVMLTSCGKSNQPIKPPVSQSSPIETSETLGSDSSKSENSESSIDESKAPETPKLNVVYGEIIDATMNTVIIRTDDGRELHFSTEDIVINTIDGEGILIGDVLAVYYDGEIVDNDTTQVTISHIDEVDQPE